MKARCHCLVTAGLVPSMITLASILAILSALILATKAPFGAAIAGFFDGALGGHRLSYLMATLSRATLIAGMALSVMLSLRAGLFNIGGEGQLVAGGISSALVALAMPGPPLVVLTVSILAGMAAGAAWALFAGVLHLHAGVPLLIGSLLMNFPVRFIASYLVGHPFRDVPSGMLQSPPVPAGTWLPYFPGLRLDIGILFIVAISVAAILYTSRTVHGYHARLIGLAPSFAGAVGLPVGRLTLQTLAMSGAIAGFAGAIAVFGIHHRYVDGMLVQPLYAWTGLIAVLLVGMRPWLVPFSAFFFSALQTGAAGMERAAQVPQDIGLVMQAVIILFFAGGITAALRSPQRTDKAGADA